MKYDIYYILEKWAPDLTKNKIYQKLIKEIIPLEDSYKVSDIDQEEKYIDINPTEDGKTIRVNPIGKDEKRKWNIVAISMKDTMYCLVQLLH